MKTFVIIMTLLGLTATPVIAKEKDALATEIKVEVGKVSEVVFPDRVVKVVKGGAPDSILVEVMDQAVYLLPKIESPADIFVTTSSGKSYPLLLKVAVERDIKVHVGGSSKRHGQAYGYTDVMDLMKDLLLGHQPVMSTPFGTQGDVFFETEDLKLVIERAYQMNAWRAYVLKMHNLTAQELIVPIERIVLPDLLAISADKDILSAKGQQEDKTLVYVITGFSS